MGVELFLKKDHVFLSVVFVLIGLWLGEVWGIGLIICSILNKLLYLI